MQDTTEPSTVEDEMLDIDPVMRPVVIKYGRKMWALVMNAGMAGQAADVLAVIVQKHQSKHGAHAVGVLAQSFNQLSNAYVEEMGWEEGLVAQCDRDIQLAYAGKLLVVEGVQQLDA